MLADPLETLDPRDLGARLRAVEQLGKALGGQR